MEQVIKRVNVSDLRDGLALALRKVEYGGLCYVVHRHGRPVAALVSMEVINKYWDAENVYDPVKKETPEPVPEPKVHGFAGRLWARRKRRAVGRTAQGEDEAEADGHAYQNFRGLGRGV